MRRSRSRPRHLDPARGAATEGGRLTPSLKWLLTATCVVVLVAGLRAASVIAIPLVIALFLALISFPAVRWLERRRVPAVVAVLLTMAGILATLVGPGLVIAAAALQFAAAAPDYEARLRQLLADATAWLDVRDIDLAWLAGVADPAQLFNLMAAALTGLVTTLSGAVLVVLIAGFMLLDAAIYLERQASRSTTRSSQALARITEDLQRYLWVKTIVSVATGVAAGLWVALLGVDFPILWGLVAFLFNYVPNLGSLVAAFPPALLALIQFGPFEALLVLAGYLVLNTVFGYVVEPYLMGRQLGLSPFVVLFSVIAWGWIWGIGGMLLSVPLTMALALATERSDEWRWLSSLLRGIPPVPPMAPRAASGERTRG